MGSFNFSFQQETFKLYRQSYVGHNAHIFVEFKVHCSLFLSEDPRQGEIQEVEAQPAPRPPGQGTNVDFIF